MIAHIVLFWPRPDLTDTQKQSILDAFTQAASRIATVKRCRVGRRVAHGLPGYESVMRGGFEYAAIVEFEDLNGLKAYLTDPAHAAIGTYFTSAAENALAYDYEMVEIADVRAEL